MNLNKLNLEVNSQGNRVKWSAQGLPLANYENADFWRIYMDDDYEREILVKSSSQTGKLVKTQNGEDIVYDGIVNELGRKFDVKLTVHIVRNEKELSFYADIENNDDARVNELQLPFIELSKACSENREDDVVYRCKGLGEKIVNPWKAIDKDHTEYMAADYREIWSPLIYPRPANMAWYGMETGGHFLYIAKYDDKARTCVFNIGTNARNRDPRLIFTICHYPLALKGEKLPVPKVVASLTQNDWRYGSDEYSAWARKSFFKPCKKPDWVHNFTGWQRVILRHQYGEVFWKYQDLPALWEEGKKYGIDMLLVFGWWKGRFDNGYPLYEPDPALGGAEELKKAIKTIQDKGGRVALYTNGILMDVKSDFYKEVGHKICTKDIDGNEYHDHYRFANSGTILRQFGYKTFVKACMSTPEWTDKLLENGKIKLSFGPDSIFYDQIGGHHCWLCFDKSHPHGNRGDMDPYYRAQKFKAMRTLLTDDKALGSETTVDFFASYLDYHHGCDLGNWNAPGAFPQMFIRTFPEIIMTNRFLHDCRPDFKMQLNYAFAMGYRFDVSIYRGRVVGIEGELPFAQQVKKLIDLKEKWHRFFYEGQFVVDTIYDLPQGILMTEFKNGDEHLLVFVNLTNEAITFSANGSTKTLEANEVECELKK